MVIEEHGVDTFIESRPAAAKLQAHAIQSYRGENMEIFENILHCIY